MTEMMVSVERQVSAAQRVQSLVRTIGKNEQARVVIGKPGGENFYDWQQQTVQIDSNDLLRHEEEWLGIGAHESMHCRITDWRMIPEEIIQDMGFNSLLQTIEDIRVYYGTRNMYEGAGEWIRKAVSAEVDGESGRLNLQKIEDRVQQHYGYIPHSTRFCVELQKRRVAGVIDDTDLPDIVRRTLENTSEYVDQIITGLPDKDATPADSRQCAENSYQIVHTKIWPEYQKLIERDRENQEIFQMLRYMTSSKEGEALHKLVGMDVGQSDREHLDNLLTQVKDFVKAAERSSDVRQMRYLDLDNMPSSLRTAVLDAKKILEQKDTERMNRDTNEALKKIEDEMVKALRPKLMNPEQAETHEENQKRVDSGQPRKLEDPKAKPEELAPSYSWERDKSKEPTYAQTLIDLHEEIDELYRRLDEILSPTKFPRWKKGYEMGGRINIDEAMQFEANPNRYNRLMERLSIPNRRDFRFTMLVDLSGSMIIEGKINHAFKTTVLFAEVLNRLGIDFEILGFNTLPREESAREPYVFKEYGVPFRQEHKEKIEKMFDQVWSAEAGYNDDPQALLWASKRLDQHPGRDNFLVVVSDGAPVSSPEWYHHHSLSLEDAVKDVMQKLNQFLIGLGIGSGGVESVKQYYPNHQVFPNVKELALGFGALLEDMIANPERYRRH